MFICEPAIVRANKKFATVSFEEVGGQKHWLVLVFEHSLEINLPGSSGEM